MADTCSVKGWCPGMTKMLGMASARIEVANFIELTTGTVRLGGIVYRTTPRAQGVMLNYCPWCGGCIKPELFDRKRKAPAFVGKDGGK